MNAVERNAVIKTGPWILYDGTCSLCAGGAARLGPIVLRRGFRMTPLQSAIGREFRTECDEMQVITRKGGVVGGVGAFAYICRHIWWAMPAALILYLPLVQPLLNPLYHLLAANRHRISGKCELKSDKPENPYSVDL